MNSSLRGSLIGSCSSGTAAAPTGAWPEAAGSEAAGPEAVGPEPEAPGDMGARMLPEAVRVGERSCCLRPFCRLPAGSADTS